MNLDGSNVASLTIKYYDVNGNLTYQAAETLDPHAAKDIVPRRPQRSQPLRRKKMNGAATDASISTSANG